MHKHKLLNFKRIVEEKIGSLKEEVEIGTNVKLNVIYIADRRDEIEFLQWTTRTIQSILNRDIDERATTWDNQKAVRDDGYDRISELASRTS